MSGAQNPPATRETQDQLMEHARDQTDFLIRSCNEWDVGQHNEAKRIAVHLRVLLHHNEEGSSKALLMQTGYRDRLRFLDSGGEFEAGDLFLSSLVTLGVSSATGGLEWMPRYGELSRREVNLSDQVAAARKGQSTPRPPGGRIRFAEWWDAIVVKDTAGREYTRRKLVLAVANQEGGAHVDPRTKADIQALAHENSMGWTGGPGGRPSVPAGSPIPATIRQIAWEFHSTIYSSARDLMHEHHRKVAPRHLPPGSRNRISIGGMGTSNELPRGATIHHRSR